MADEMEDFSDDLYDKMQHSGEQALSDSYDNAINAPGRLKQDIDGIRNVNDRLKRIQEIGNGKHHAAKNSSQVVRQGGANVQNAAKTARTTQSGVKAAQTGAKATARTAKAGIHTARSGSKAVQTGSKAVQIGAKATRKAGQIAKALAKIAKESVKAAVETVKKFIEWTIETKGIFLIVVVVLLIIIFIIVGVYVAVKSHESSGATQSYVDSNNSLNHYGYIGLDDSNQRDTVSGLSAANAACKAYYEELSKQSVWQLQADGSLINATDENAKHDYFKRDEDLQLDADFLYTLNNYLIGDNFVYPEVFLQPVSYDADNMELIIPVDDSGNVTVTSHVRNNVGAILNETENTLADYGFGSVVTYSTQHITKTLTGEYIGEDVWDEKNERVVRVNYETPTSFSIVLADKEVDVLDDFVCMAGSVHYNYTTREVVDESVEAGSVSENENELVQKILIGTKTVTIYKGTQERPIYGPSGQIIDYKTVVLWDSLAYLEAHKYKVDLDSKMEKTVPMYKYRSATTCILEKIPVASGSDKTYTDKGTEYYYAYLNKFGCYMPTGASRNYGALKQITTIVPSSAYHTSGTGGSGSASVTEQEFIDAIAPVAQEDMKESGILASVTMAQCILESGWGESTLAKDYNNYFGIKAGSNWKGATVDMETTEQDSAGNSYTVTATFCVFDSVSDSIRQHSIFLWNVKSGDSYRYRAVAGVTDYREAVQMIKDGGYATDVGYVDKLCNVIEKYNLTQYDTEVWDGSIPEYADADDGSGSGGDGTESYFYRSLSENDRAIFNNFVHAFDDLPDGKTAWSYHTTVLTENDMKNILIYTNNLRYGTMYSEENVDEMDMLSDGFIGYMARGRRQEAAGQFIDDFVYYDQHLEPWASHPLGTGGATIDDSGCGVCCYAMIVSNLTDEVLLPQDAGDYLVENGYWNGGTYHSAYTKALPENYSLYCSNSMGTDLDKALELLKNGGFIVCSVRGTSNLYSGDGHLLLIRGIADNGELLLLDPNSTWRVLNEDGSYKSWAVEDVQSILTHCYYVNTKAP